MWTVCAHKDAITVIEIVPHHGHTYVLTGSMDKNVAIHTDRGICIGCFGNKDGWRLENSVQDRKQVPPRPDVRYTKECPEETKGAAPVLERTPQLEARRNIKGLLKYVAPFKQVDLSQFHISTIPTNYEELYFQLFNKKLDKKMKP